MSLFFFRKISRMLKPVAQSYERRLDQLGPDARAVFWRSEEHQLIRFEILYDVFSMEDQAAGGISIADFGCGYGAFFDFLKDMPVMQNSSFVGYDMSRKMIEAARSSIRDPRAQFRQQLTVTDPADYVFACGTYNMHMGANEDDWADYIRQSLKELWSMTGKTLAFNLLRQDGDDDFQGLYYADPNEFLEFCRRELSINATMTNDAPLPDCTFIVRR